MDVSMKDQQIKDARMDVSMKGKDINDARMDVSMKGKDIKDAKMDVSMKDKVRIYVYNASRFKCKNRGIPLIDLNTHIL